MLTKSDVTQIRGVVREEVETVVEKRLKPIKKQLGSVDTRLGTIDKRLDTLEMKIEVVNNKIDKSQEETIEAISELIHTGYNNHEKRIKRIENHLQLPQST